MEDLIYGKVGQVYKKWVGKIKVYRLDWSSKYGLKYLNEIVN